MADVGQQPTAGPQKVTDEQLGRHVGSAYEEQLEFDLGNLAASDPSPLDAEAFTRDPVGACKDAATRVAQALLARLFALPSEPAPVGRIATLPEPTTVLPRHKPLPKPREPTRWEKFAQRKGIAKKKRSKLAWDEEAGEWRRRYGYKRKGDEADIPIVEAGAADQVGEDPFSAMRTDKRARVAANEGRRVANLKASAKAAKGTKSSTGVHAGGLPATLNLAAALPVHGQGTGAKRKALKADIGAASRQAGVSTASLGKFDARVAGEKPGERALGAKRRKFDPVTGPPAAQAAKTRDAVEAILAARADDVLDVPRAIGALEAERRAARHAAKQAAAADADGNGLPGKSSHKAGHKGKTKGFGKGDKRPGGSKGGSGVSVAKGRAQKVSGKSRGPRASGKMSRGGGRGSRGRGGGRGSGRAGGRGGGRGSSRGRGRGR